VLINNNIFKQGGTNMRKSISIGIVLLLALAFNFTATAAENEISPAQHMPGYGHMPGYNNPWNPNPGYPPNDPYNPNQPNPYYGYRYGSFKVADLNLDGEAEIILLGYNTITVTDNQGEIQFTKQVEGLNNYYGGGFCGMMGGYGTHMGQGSLEVANLDGDEFPEIIIKSLGTLIVLDNEGNPETTITLPQN
jgi:hypothetical protein